MTEKLLGWHFCAKDRKLGYGDGRLIVEGETLSVDCEPVLCVRGLHVSERIIDALRYASGSILCRVESSGSIVRGYDKAVATHRKTLWMFDATNALRDFAATVAENALLAERAAGREPDPRSWAAVQFVRDLLAGKIEEEDREAAEIAAESARKAAESAELSAALSAAWNAALIAAWSARKAALIAAWNAAESARKAAESAALIAAWNAAESAAWNAARKAAESAALSAAWNAALIAAWSAAMSAQNDLLLQIIEKWRTK